jgi:predicted O-linked N-acetylglucosamine transferase (SPINDLY family)
VSNALTRQERKKQEKNPDHWYWRGRACLEAQNWVGAISALGQGIKLAPKQAAFYRARALALARLNRFSEAIRDLHVAIRLMPSMALAHSDLGVCLLKTHRPQEAIAPLQQALRLEPSLEQARACLGLAYAHSGQPDLALEILDVAVRDDPDPEIHSARAWAMLNQGRLQDALDALHHTLSLNPTHEIAHFNILFTLQHKVGVTVAELLAAHQHWASVVAAPPPPPDLFAGRRPARQLRLGVVSGDLRRHAVSNLTLRAFEALAARGVAVTCFANQSEEDSDVARWRKIARAWHKIDEMSDDALTELIRSEPIDILFDLAGLTARHRLPVLARRVAPLQVTWAGYTGTTGLAAMDGLIADAREVPAGEDEFYTETVIRLPDCYVCYQPPVPTPDGSAEPPSVQAPPVFGCFQRASKLNVELLRLWAAIAQAVPQATFLLRYTCFAEQPACRVIGDMARQAGLDPDRLRFEAGGDPYSMMQAYNRVDVVLDTRPYSGGVTTLEALWMGAPVITWPGETFAGRHSASHLHAAGLHELIAISGEDYVQRAISLAADIDRLRDYRRTLRARLQASPLCDAERFATNLNDALTAFAAARGAPRGTAREMADTAS